MDSLGFLTHEISHHIVCYLKLDVFKDC